MSEGTSVGVKSRAYLWGVRGHYQKTAKNDFICWKMQETLINVFSKVAYYMATEVGINIPATSI